MYKIKSLFISILLLATNVHATTMSLEQVLQSVIDNYPSIQIATLQVDKADQNTARILSRLGWRLSAQAGISNDVAFTGSTVKQAKLGANLEKITSSGNSISLTTQSLWEDAKRPFVSKFSNPGTVSNATLSYRHPLQKGNGNIAHHVSLANNQQQIQLAQANLSALYHQLANQITGLYFSAANTLSRLDNIRQAIGRTQRLQKFISGRLNLGIAENKDQLQVDAQYKNQYAQLKALEVVWLEQQIALNQLMGKKWNHSLKTVMPKASSSTLADLQIYIQDVYQQDPQLIRIDAQIQIAQNQIKLQRENKRNNVDLILHIGQQVRSRDFPLDTKDYSETVGGIRIEYNSALDKSGRNAEIFQAQLDKDILLQQKSLRQQEIRYEVASLLAGLEAAQTSTRAFQASIQSEQAKLKEADSRYRRGRIDIDLLLQFKAQLSSAELSQSLELIQQNSREYQLKRLRGKIWQSIKLPNQNSLPTKSSRSSIDTHN